MGKKPDSTGSKTSSQSHILAMINAVEDDPSAQGFDIESWSAWLLRLAPESSTAKDGYESMPVSREATLAPPGSEEKIRVMMRRVEMGLSLFHPRDAKME